MKTFSSDTKKLPLIIMAGLEANKPMVYHLDPLNGGVAIINFTFFFLEFFLHSGKNFKATSAITSGVKFDIGPTSHASLEVSPTCMHQNKLYIFGDYRGSGVDSKC